MTTYTFKIEKAIGYSGAKSGKSYIAEIKGTDRTYIFCREFIDTTETDPAEYFAARRKHKGVWTEAAAVPVGLYEVSRFGEKLFYAVWIKDDKVGFTVVSEDRAAAMAILMDAGHSAESARLATKPATKTTAQ